MRLRLVPKEVVPSGDGINQPASGAALRVAEAVTQCEIGTSCRTSERVQPGGAAPGVPDYIGKVRIPHGFDIMMAIVRSRRRVINVIRMEAEYENR